ncbi:MAG: rhomboid family intramembrane serine protease [Firmicutes bacterium]|nr:rhomboid family intramembrane serine protease [Bacillota bacterium]
MDLLKKLERKIGRLAISHLMYYICGGMLIVFLTDYLLPQVGLGSLLALDLSRVGQGEVWRLITFVFSPVDTSPLWILFSLYLYCLIGESLEREWGSFRFCLFYLTGMFGAILAALFTGYGVNTYLNLSLFLAFAFFYPDFQLMLFFFIPVKVKYLAAADVVLMVYSLVVGSWSTRIAIIFSLLNVVLYFGGYFLKHLRQWLSFRKTRSNFRKYMK